MRWWWLPLLMFASLAWGAGDDFNFFGDQPIPEAAVVHVAPPKPLWMTTGGPLALLGFFFTLCFIVKWFIPFRETGLRFDLHDLPVAAQRGIGMAVVLFGIAFCFGGLEVNYQMGLHGSAEAYFGQMSQGKLIAFTHAHLFGFTTSFLLLAFRFRCILTG